MFYIKVLGTVIWFMITATLAVVIGVIRWKNPSGGNIFASTLAWGVKYISGVKVHVAHADRLLSTQPCIYVANHQSNIDLLVQANCYMPRTVCIGKKELLWLPFFGLLFYVTGNIMLDRKNHQKAMAGMGEARHFLQERKISVYMFPEGTRNINSENLLPFKRGAFHLAIAAQVPILPVVSCRLAKFFDMKNRKINAGTAQIEILEPIPTKGMVPEDVDRLLELTYARMQEAFVRLNASL